MADNRGMDMDPGWVNRKFQEIDRKIEGVRSERRSRATTITDGDLVIRGGGKLVVDGGDFLLLDTDGSTVFRLGPQQHGDRGVTISRDTGEVALSVRKKFDTDTIQIIELVDRFGNVLLSEEAIGSGPARPLHDIPMRPVMATSGNLQCGPWGPEVTTGAGTFTTVHQAWFARSNQFASLRILMSASDLTTAAEVQVINADDSTVLAAFGEPDWLGERDLGDTDYVEIQTPGLFLPGVPWESISIALQVRVSAGAGTITTAIPEARGGFAL